MSGGLSIDYFPKMPKYVETKSTLEIFSYDLKKAKVESEQSQNFETTADLAAVRAEETQDTHNSLLQRHCCSASPGKQLPHRWRCCAFKIFIWVTSVRAFLFFSAELYLTSQHVQSAYVRQRRLLVVFNFRGYFMFYCS